MIEPGSAAPGPGTVSLADEEGVKQVFVGTILGLWEIVNNLTRLRPSTRKGYRVTIQKHHGRWQRAQNRPAPPTA